MNELREYELAKDMAKTVIRFANLNKTTHPGIIDQLVRAAISVPCNVAESRGRMLINQIVQYLGVARGSAYEVRAVLEVLDCDFENLLHKIDETIKAIDLRLIQLAQQRVETMVD